MKRILFVCTGNTCRSSMAEALFKYLLNIESLTNGYAVRSAGTAAFLNMPASAHAIKALEELKIDLKSHVSKPITKEMIKEADLILAMTRSHKSFIVGAVPEASPKTYTLKEYTGVADREIVDISDPYGGDIEVYRSCREEILDDLKKALNKLKMEE